MSHDSANIEARGEVATLLEDAPNHVTPLPWDMTSMGRALFRGGMGNDAGYILHVANNWDALYDYATRVTAERDEALEAEQRITDTLAVVLDGNTGATEALADAGYPMHGERGKITALADRIAAAIKDRDEAVAELHVRRRYATPGSTTEQRATDEARAEVERLRETLRRQDICWHCGVYLVPVYVDREKPHCDQCPAEDCDVEGCEEMGCADAYSHNAIDGAHEDASDAQLDYARHTLRLIVEAQPEWRTAVDSIVEERHPELRRERHAKCNACVDRNSTTRDESVVGDVGCVVHKPWCPQLKEAT